MKKVFKPFLKILAGTAAAQFLILASMPWVARLYTPSDYGLFGVLTALSTLTAIIATMQLHQAIVLPRVLSHARGLFELACFSSVGGGLLAAASALIYLTAWASGSSEASSWSLPALAGITAIAMGIGQAIQALAARLGEFGTIGRAAIARAIVVVGVQVSAAGLPGGAHALLSGFAAGEIAAILYIWKGAVPRISSGGRRKWLWYYSLLKRFRDFAGYGTAQEAMNSASQGVPVLLLGSFFGSQVAGHYAFTMRVLMGPINLVANAARQVMSVRLTENLRHTESLTADYRRATLSLGALALLPAVILIPLLPDLYAVLFGLQWEESARMAQWLITACAFGVCNVPSTLVFRVFRRQKEGFALNTLLLCMRVGTLVVGGTFLSALETVACFAAVGCIWNLAIILLASHWVNRANSDTA